MSVVGPESHVTLHYRLVARLESGEREVASTFGARAATLQLGAGQLAPGIEAKLMNLAIGAHAVFDLAPDEAYGARLAELVQTISRAAFDRECEPGLDYAPGDVVQFRAAPRAQGERRVAGVLKRLDAREVVVDFNHPLAGVPLRFEVKVIGVL
jgi:FKBP-type peptidyl-prolyl cis-trans isomerase SlpA